MSQEKEIKIRPLANYHGQFLMVLALVLFSLTLLINKAFIPEYKLVHVGLTLICGVVFVTGFLKKIQPTYSFILNQAALCYCHSVGRYCLPWKNIKYLAPVSSTYGVEQVSLPYIGIKLGHMDVLTQIMPPRLANKLIHEQKPLLIWAITHDLITVEQSVINFSPYKQHNGKEIKGPLAAFLHQVDVLEQALGFHLYLPSSAFDRDINEFNQLLRQCQSHATEG